MGPWENNRGVAARGVTRELPPSPLTPARAAIMMIIMVITMIIIPIIIIVTIPHYECHLRRLFEQLASAIYCKLDNSFNLWPELFSKYF